METDKHYSGQILPIVMIILIVGVIVALALMSRTMKGHVRVVDEKHASEASERVDSVLDSVQSMTRQEVFGKLSASPDWSNTGKYCVQAGYGSDGVWQDAISGFIGSEGVGFDEHSAAVKANTEDELCFEKVQETGEALTVLSDEVFSIPIDGADADCDLELSFDNGQAAVVSVYYANVDAAGGITGIKPYAFSDVSGVCISGGTCSGSTGWTVATSKTVSLDAVGGYDPYEVRVRAIGSSLLLNINSVGACDNILFVRVTASSNNSGNYQSSYYYLPVRDSAPPLFDYVLLGSSGQIRYIE